MRKIKFRVRNKNHGEWCYFSLPWGDELYLSDNLDPETCSQFTGLLDKSGKEIYEGDIFRVSHGGVGYVQFRRAAFVAVSALSELDEGELDGQEIEVIGNIYENPGLISSN
jgi:hypothetical protein